MENEQITKEELIRLKAKFTQKYGIEMDDWTAAMFNEVDEAKLTIEKFANAAIQEIVAAANTVKGQVKNVYFDNNYQAFWFGFGKLLIPSAVLLIASLLYSYYKFSNQEFQEKREFVNAFPKTSDLRLFIQGAEIEKIDGKLYVPLKIKPTKEGDIMIGQEYLFDEKNKRVLVPLGRD